MRSDAELIKAYASARDEAAFAELVARHGAMVYRTCMRVLGNGHDAEEASQATFVVLVRKAGGLSGGGELAGWLHSVARNVALRSRRGRLRRSRSEEDAAMQRSAGAAVPAPGESAPVLGEDLDRELAALSAGQRQAVVLRYLEGRSEKEAAEAAGVPVGTLSRRASDGLERLRQRLCGRGQVLGSTALVGLLGAEATAAVPATLLPSILAVSKLAAAGAAAGTAGLSAVALGAKAEAGAMALAEGAMKAMFWIKVKLAAAVLVGAAAVGGGGAAVILAAAEPAVPKAQGPMPKADSGVVEQGIECRVTELVAGGKVKLSAGSAQGVREKFEFDVSRDGKPVGTVKVVGVEEKQCTAEIASVTGEIKVGDTARTRFGTVIAKPGEKPAGPAEAGKIAWGEAVNGLQAGLIPLGGGAVAQWSKPAVCPKCDVPHVVASLDPWPKCQACGQSMPKEEGAWARTCSACAATKRICQGCGAARPWGATFAEGEPLHFEIHYRNVLDKAIELDEAASEVVPVLIIHNVERTRTYHIVRPSRKGEGNLLVPAARAIALVRTIGDGCSLLEMNLEQPGVPDKSLPRLSPGKYEVVAVYNCPALPGVPARCWRGTVTSDRIIVEIKPKAAAQVKPAAEKLTASQAGNLITIQPMGLSFRIPDGWIDWQKKFKNNVHLTAAQLAATKDGGGEWDTEFAEVVNAVLPFDRCVAAAGGEGWGKNGVSFADVQMRVYVLDEEPKTLQGRLTSDVPPAVRGLFTPRKVHRRELAGEIVHPPPLPANPDQPPAAMDVPLAEDEVSGWRRSALSYNLHYGDYGGVAKIAICHRELGGRTVAAVFMYAGGTPDQKKTIEGILGSFSVAK